MIWNLTPENLFAVRTINGFDYGYVDKKTDRNVRQLYRSWLAKAKSDPEAERAVERFRKHPEIQLYDLSQDPWELENLAELPEHRATRDRLLGEVREWMRQQGDGWLKDEGAEGAGKEEL